MFYIFHINFLMNQILFVYILSIWFKKPSWGLGFFFWFLKRLELLMLFSMKTTHSLEHLCNSYLNNEWQGEALPFKKRDRERHLLDCFLFWLSKYLFSSQIVWFSLRGLVRYTVLYIFLYMCVCTCMLSCFSRVRLFATLWTVASQAPLSMGFSRQEYWSGLPYLPPGNLPDPGIGPVSIMSAALAGEFLPLMPPRYIYKIKFGF